MVIMKNKDLVTAGLAAASLLLIPLVAMQFTDQVAWGVGDFLFAGILLAGASIAFRLMTRKSGNWVYRAAVGLFVAATLFLIWANLAVGLIGSEDNAANLMYAGVLAVGLTGAAIARFRAHQMALTLFAMAAGQTLIAIIAIIAGQHRIPGSSVAEIVNVNGFFAVLFIVSALLFRHAAEGKAQKA